MSIKKADVTCVFNRVKKGYTQGDYLSVVTNQWERFMSIVKVAGSWDAKFEPLVAAFKSNFDAQSATPEQGAGFALFHHCLLYTSELPTTPYV